MWSTVDLHIALGCEGKYCLPSQISHQAFKPVIVFFDALLCLNQTLQLPPQSDGGVW